MPHCEKRLRLASTKPFRTQTPNDAILRRPFAAVTVPSDETLDEEAEKKLTKAPQKPPLESWKWQSWPLWTVWKEPCWLSLASSKHNPCSLGGVLCFWSLLLCPTLCDSNPPKLEGSLPNPVRLPFLQGLRVLSRGCQHGSRVLPTELSDSSKSERYELI